MKLTELIAPVPAPAGLNDPEIVGLTADSRNVQPGFLFAALPGTRQDGRSFAAEAMARGAAACVPVPCSTTNRISLRICSEVFGEITG